VIAERMKPLMANSSLIRAMFEEGDKLKTKYGKDKVFDFSIGNPGAPVPPEIKNAIMEILDEVEPEQLHGYMSNAGFEDVRQTVAEKINRDHKTSFSKANILMTVGAAGGLNVALKTILNPGEEVIIFSPYFLEYDSYVSNYGGRVVNSPTTRPDFQPDLDAFEKKITEKTRVVLVNSPNNPTGVIYCADTIKNITDILKRKQEQLGREIFILVDEPYRELAYDGVDVPYLTGYYDNTIVAYSYSKSLSLPGERIGYLVIPDELAESRLVFETATNANRIIGSVNAPSLQQKLIAKCIDLKVDIDYYNRNRQALYDGLTRCGFSCIKPQGAFYLFMKSPVTDEKAFCAKAKEYNILMVPGTSFAAPGYVRLAYCVSYETIINSLPSFEKLASDYHVQ
jgi:aspartate aminotransferase